jgi:hypothetical protein
VSVVGRRNDANVPGSVMVIVSSLTVTRRPISLPLLITLIAVSSLNHRLCFSSHVLSKRAANIIGFFELAFLVPPHVSFISAGIDQLSLASHNQPRLSLLNS